MTRWLKIPLAPLIVCVSARAGAVCTPIEQWRWDGDVVAPLHRLACVTPLVVQLTDDDGDGDIDGRDVPDVVFAHGGSSARISALDGVTGVTHFTTGDPVLNGEYFAAGDIDGDGLVELIGLHEDRSHIVAFEHEGTLAWVSDPVATPLRGAIGIADLDQDGTPEIYLGATVFAADGALLWEGAAGTGNLGGIQISNAVDVDPARPGLEILAGRTLYDANGAIVWTLAVGDGWTAVADLDGDGDPEIIHYDLFETRVFDPSGRRSRSLAPSASR